MPMSVTAGSVITSYSIHYTKLYDITPPRVIYDLESRLRGVYLEELAEVVRTFFEQAGVEVLSVSPDDFVAAFNNALVRNNFV